jgi:glycosyltransferase involved in cell wall biosynthesis
MDLWRSDTLSNEDESMSAGGVGPRVSVLMPVYNAGPYLAEAVESILAQTFHDFEFIAVNDGSTDGSPGILQNYAARDRRMRLLDRPNTGIVGALNDGLAVARGEFIARMDGDDISLPDRFALQLAFLEAHPDHVAVGAQGVMIDSDGDAIAPLEAPLTHEAIDALNMAGQGSPIPHPVAMIRREPLERLGGYRREYQDAEDSDLFLRLAELGRLANLPDRLLKYRINPTSVSRIRPANQRKQAWEAVAAAHQRRGLPVPPVPDVFREKLEDGGESDLVETNFRWTRKSLDAGYRAAAWKRAWKCLARNPGSWRAWRPLAYVVLGETGYGWVASLRRTARGAAAGLRRGARAPARAGAAPEGPARFAPGGGPRGPAVEEAVRRRPLSWSEATVTGEER